MLQPLSVAQAPVMMLSVGVIIVGIVAGAMFP
jgi:hypothetical protein